MINAKQEFLNHISDKPKGCTVRCCIITHGPSYEYDVPTYILPVGYTKEDQELFLEQINFDYDNGYGGQMLEGTIWYTDGITWSSRGEYDGSEWWELNVMPKIAPELMGDTSSKL